VKTWNLIPSLISFIVSPGFKYIICFQIQLTVASTTAVAELSFGWENRFVSAIIAVNERHAQNLFGKYVSLFQLIHAGMEPSAAVCPSNLWLRLHGYEIIIFTVIEERNHEALHKPLDAQLGYEKLVRFQCRSLLLWSCETASRTRPQPSFRRSDNAVRRVVLRYEAWIS
jgi:hypothetical protein